MTVHDLRRGDKGSTFYAFINPFDVEEASSEPKAAGGNQTPTTWCPRGHVYLCDLPLGDDAGKAMVANSLREAAEKLNDLADELESKPKRRGRH